MDNLYIFKLNIHINTNTLLFGQIFNFFNVILHFKNTAWKVFPYMGTVYCT